MPARLKTTRRQAVRARLPQRCAVCGSAEQLTLDHIVPRVYGGTNELSSLQLLCLPCHQLKSRSEVRYRDERANQAKGRRLRKKLAQAGSQPAVVA